MLGDLLLELGRSGPALEEFERSQKSEPNRFLGLYGAARAAQSSGDAAKAKQYYTQVLALAQAADGERPEIKQARAYLGK
jgi:uncharacterized protein HemY